MAILAILLFLVNVARNIEWDFFVIFKHCVQEFDMLMGIMCRSIKMEFQKVVDYGNVKTNRFVMSPKTFEKNAPENKCYGSNSELPDGIFSVEKCVQGVPMAVSLPHFLHADEW